MTAATSSAQNARISGVVFDSLHGTALRGAEVHLADLTAPSQLRVTLTDSTGAFSFDQVGAGRYGIGFLHPLLDSLALDPRTHEVAVPGDTASLTLFVPSARAMVRSICRADVQVDSTGLFLGRVRRVGDKPAASGGVQVSWAELRFNRLGVERKTPTLTAQTGPGGWFAICGVPLETPISVRAWIARDSTGLLELDIPANGLLRRDLYASDAKATVSVQTTSTRVPRDGFPPLIRHDTVSMTRSVKGAGRLRGRVVASTGAPVAEVRVALWGTGHETLTDPDGRFEMDSVPAGSQTLIARFLGFRPYRAIVDIVPPDEGQHEVTLEPLVVALDTVRVLVPLARDSWRAGFDERRRVGQGEFILDTEIARRNSPAISTLLQGTRGLDIIATGPFRKTALMRSLGGGQCVPTVLLDGIRVVEGADDLDLLVNPTDIAAVEVYPRASLVPTAFVDARSVCGAIVIWTTMKRR